MLGSSIGQASLILLYVCFTHGHDNLRAWASVRAVLRQNSVAMCFVRMQIHEVLCRRKAAESTSYRLTKGEFKATVNR